jgi:hypothetical protein
VSPNAEFSGRLALSSGMGALFVAVSFASLHQIILLDWPTVGLERPATMVAYFAAGTAFQLGTPVLCLAAVVFGASARSLWTTRIGLACAGAALLGYALYVRSCLEMIR